MILSSFILNCFHSADQLTANQSPALYDCLLLSGRLLSLMSCADKNKHGKKKKSSQILIISWTFNVTFLHAYIAACLSWFSLSLSLC